MGKPVFISSILLLLSSILVPVLAKDPDQASVRQNRLFAMYEQQAIEKGWKRLTMEVDGRERQMLFRSPGKTWRHGVIILLHGGGGTYSNFAANLPIGKPMVDFSEMALKEGFAVISPDSTDGVVTGGDGVLAGKRWDCLARDNHKNVDLPFLFKIITDLIPGLRPAGSSRSVFLTGISNGGFMTTLAATSLSDKIAAFAPVSSGDPYGTYLKCGEWQERTTAPGIFYDAQTDKPISKKGAGASDSYPSEKKWPDAKNGKKPAFKQFHHELDAGVDPSCMKKASRMLKEHGYRDDGCMLLSGSGKPRLIFHFWRAEYNQPMLEFFKKNACD
ncbi:MAG: hypothetical protein IT342_03240 [Candidatus Melainabacteria bacterium]|nr:hypothetical protein [Candidatus Melainabacteria bacterium]